MSVEGVCFDATGTLIEPARPVGEVYRELALRFGVGLPAWRLDDAFRRVLAHAPPRGLDGDSPSARREGERQWWSERVRQTFQAADSTVRFERPRDLAEALFDAYREPERWRVRPDVRSTLERLAHRGLPMCVVSNFDHRLLDLLEVLDLSRFFGSIWIPSECGHRKPQKEIFEAAAEALGWPLERLAYVGDDDPATRDAIAGLGLRVIDVGTLGPFPTLTERIASAATLRPASRP